MMSWPMRRSSVKSDDAAHRRKISAPFLSAITCGGERVAERFRHLAALLVEHKAVRQHRAIRRAAARAAAFQQRRLEPAAMLVGAFEIEIGAIRFRPLRFDGIFHRKDMGRAGIEPDIQNVVDLLVIVRIAISPRKRCGGELNQASAPSASKASSMRSLRRPDRSALRRVFLSTKIASGTPQARWRDSTQSGRASTIDADAVLGRCCGYHFVSAIAFIASSRNVLPFEPSNRLVDGTNHCGVARKITGALERQLVRIGWRSVPLASSLPPRSIP